MHPNVPRHAGQPGWSRSVVANGAVGFTGRVGRRRTARPWDLLLVAAAALILIAVARLHAFFPPLQAVRPALVVSVIAITALGLQHSGPRSLARLRHPITYVILFIICCAVAGVPFGLYPGNSFGYLLGAFVSTLIIVVVIAASVRDAMDFRRLLMVYAMGAIAYSVLGQGTGGFRDIGGGGYDPNDAAMFIVSGIPLVFFFLFKAGRGWARLFFAVGLVSCISAVVLSGSRGGFLALVAVLAFSIFFVKGIKPIVRFATVVAVLAVLSFQATGDFWERMDTILDEDDYNRHSLTGRFEIWSRGTDYMTENPLLGVGIDNFTVAEGRHPDIVAMIQSGRGVRYSAPHSIWVQTGAELGIPALLAFIGLFGMSFRHLLRLGRGRWRYPGSSPDLQSLAEMSRPLVGVLLGILVAGTFLSHAYSPLLWVGVAFVLSSAKLLHIEEGKALKRASFPSVSYSDEPYGRKAK